MKLIRKHWYDIGGLFALLVLGFVGVMHNSITNYQQLMWLHLVALFCHQLEEYRFPGTFPGMLNKAVYKSELPDRYPLNTNTALIVNVGLGWLGYFLAAILGDKAVWLGLAVILVSLGNIMTHTLAFNIKGKTFYNAGLVTSWLLLAPCVFFFFQIVYGGSLIKATDYLLGLPLGILLIVIGIIKMITWLADKDTTYAFEKRNLLPKDRND